MADDHPPSWLVGREQPSACDAVLDWSLVGLDILRALTSQRGFGWLHDCLLGLLVIHSWA